MKAIVVRSNAAPEVITLERQEGSLLTSMQTILGGYIELAVSMPQDSGRTLDYFCDEEAKIKQVPPAANRYCPHLADWILGPILVTATNDEGETVGLTDAEIATVYEEIGGWGMALEDAYHGD